MKHGTATTYQYHGCRCDDCREAQRLKAEEFRRSRGVRPRAERRKPLTHPSLAAYQRYGCRCRPCREFNSAYRQGWRPDRDERKAT